MSTLLSGLSTTRITKRLYTVQHHLSRLPNTQPYIHATNFCKPIFCAIHFPAFSRFGMFRDVISVTSAHLGCVTYLESCLLKFIIHICSLHTYLATEQEKIYCRRNNEMLLQVVNLYF